MSEQAKAAKTQRLAAALRDNLRRRKVARSGPKTAAEADARSDLVEAGDTEPGLVETASEAKKEG